MRCGRPAIAALVLLIAMLPAQGAQLGPGRSGVCQLTLKGPIEEGDSDKLAKELDFAPLDRGIADARLCLDSPGGNYDEGLKLVTLVLKHTNVATVIDRGAECYSACAFLFLAGNAQKSEDGELGPDRTLDVRGTLGFHAPYLTSATSTDATEATIENFRRGVSAIAKLLEIDRRELFPRGLLAKALQVGPEELLFVDTVEKAGVWSIKLKGYKLPAALSSHLLDQACRNKDLWTNFSHTVLGRPAEDPEELHGLRQSDFPEIRGSNEPIKLAQGKHRETLDMFGYEATNFCVADVYLDSKKRLFLSLQMVPTDRQDPIPDELAQQVEGSLDQPQTLDLLTTPLWYVYAPETPLKSIALP
jgi:hypothetical protein